MKFETQKYDSKKLTPVHCSTKQEAEELMVFLTKHNYTWNNKNPLIGDEKWVSYRERTVYFIWTDFTVSFAHVQFCRDNNLIPISFSDFMMKYSGPSLEEIMTDLDQRIQSMEERSTNDF